MKALIPNLVLLSLLYGLFIHVPAQGALEVLQTQSLPGGTVRVLFQDTDPPTPYSVQELESQNPQSPWAELPWYTLECVQPARFAVEVPGAVQDPGFFRVAVGAGSDLPLVIASNPANGATGVSPELTKITITFDREMAPTAGVQADANWGASYVTWSADHRTVEIHRLSAAEVLPANATLRLTLNAGGAGFADIQGRKPAQYALAFTTGTASIAGPYVVWSNPSSGAMDVDPFFDTVELRFSEPMMPTGGFTSSGWWPWSMTWSQDGRTAYVARGTAGTPLYGHTASLSPFSFRSATGTLMTAPFTLKFTTADPPTERIEANPAKGFYWPYYLLIPPAISAPKTLLVEPNNTGTWGDDPWFHEDAALGLLRWRSSFAVELGCPLLVPVFPRPQNPPAPEPGGLYVHALDRYSLSNQWDGIEQIDLQMLAMIDDALQRLRDKGHAMDNKVFMMGFSASGAFTSRFSILHPERLKAAAPGSPGGWPAAPVTQWQGTALPYPFGIKDLQPIAGQGFNLQAFKQVALFIYVGGSDYNDALDWRGLTTEEENAIKALLNYPADRLLANRWPLAESIYESVGANATFRVYPGVAHTITEDMFDDLRAFFSSHR
ncbi:MAG: Ig-like domain-containing protein [Oceanipulchritudo sp.]